MTGLARWIRGAGRPALRSAVVLAVIGVVPSVVFSSPAAAAVEPSALVVGNDISWPQCGSTYPVGQSFGIVGLNGGVSDTLNPCFGPSVSSPAYTDSELYWAVTGSTGSSTQPQTSIYLNTGDPGDVFNGNLVADWPSSGTTPYGDCTTTTVTTNSGQQTAGDNTPACAWMFGAQQANQDIGWLQAAATAIDSQSPPVSVSGAAGSYPWWLDVETGNTWQSGASGQAMNIAVLQGMVAALDAVGAAGVGVYSTSFQWGVITGGTNASTPSLGGLPNWVPGAGDQPGAEANCASASFTGGPVVLTQWTTSVDNDFPCGDSIARVYGTDAIGTSIAISEQEFPANGSATSVVLARSDFFADALAGGPLAAATGGPMLITPGASISSNLDPRVQAEIQRVLPSGGTVYVLGGDLALSPNIDTTLMNLGYKVVREAGATEYATAVDIAQQLGDPSTVFEATGLSFFDALSAVPAAIKEHAAILLTDGATQAPETAAYLTAHPPTTRYAIGGPLAAAGADPGATAVYGPDLYGTSAAVANTFFPGAGVFGAATSANFPDALGGGVLMATGGNLGPLLLVDQGPPLPSSISGYLATLSAGTPGYLFGGPLAVSGAVEAAVQAALG